MDNEIKSWLYDILNAINEIESFFIDIPKEFAFYQNDVRTRRAVERNIGIIGEAINRILKKDNSVHLSNSGNIVGYGESDHLHSYDSVSDDIMWGIVIMHLPVLKSETEKMLEEQYKPQPCAAPAAAKPQEQKMQAR